MTKLTYRGVQYEAMPHIDGALLRYLQSEKRKLVRENTELQRDANENAGIELIV